MTHNRISEGYFKSKECLIRKFADTKFAKTFENILETVLQMYFIVTKYEVTVQI